MKRIASLMLLMVAFVSGCTPLIKQPIEFRTTTNVSFSIDSGQFDVVELQSSETLLWKDSELVGIITTVVTAPQSGTATKEVKQGFIENQRSSGAAIELSLPKGAYGFASSVRGFTTAFIAVANYDEFWITISVRDDFFDELLSSISIR